jgi:hypothetical protein
MEERLKHSQASSMINKISSIQAIIMIKAPTKRSNTSQEITKSINRMISKTNIIRISGETNSLKTLPNLNMDLKYSTKRKTTTLIRIIKQQTKSNMLKMTSRAKNLLPNNHKLNPSHTIRRRITIIMEITQNNSMIISILITILNHHRTILNKDKDSIRKVNSHYLTRDHISSRIHLKRRITIRSSRVNKMNRLITIKVVHRVLILGERTKDQISSSNIK